MNTRSPHHSLPLRWLLCVVYLLLTARLGAQSAYTLVDLGANVFPASMNNTGQVVGSNYDGKPFIWDRIHGMRELQLPFPANILKFQPVAINDLGDIAGAAFQQDNVPRGFLHRNGAVTVTVIDPPDLVNNVGPGQSGVSVTGLDAEGRLSGYTTSHDGIQAAFLYDGGLKGIGPFLSPFVPGGTSIGLGIKSGQVVGGALNAQGNMQAFLYSGGQGSPLPTLGGTFSYAVALNALNQVVGYGETTLSNSFGSHLYHAFLYSGAQTVDLGTTGGFGISSASAINASGQVVGRVSSPAGFGGQAFLWTPTTPNATTGTMQLLGGLLPPYSTSLIFSDPVAINDSGEITGEAFIPPFAFGDDESPWLRFDAG